MIEQLSVTTTQVENILQSTVEQIEETFNAGCCLSWQLEDGQIQGFYSSSVRSEIQQLCQALSHSYRSTLVQGVPKAVSVVDAPPTVEGSMRELGIDCILLIPLLIKNTYSGEISLYRQSLPWTKNERQMIQAIAAQCLQNVEQARHRGQPLNLSHQVCQLLNSPHPPEQMLQMILEKVGQSFQLERVVLCELVGGHLQIYSQWRHYPAPVWIDALDSPPEGCSSDSCCQHHKVTIETVLRYESVITLPVYICGQLFGEMMLQQAARSLTPPEDQLKCVAEQVAIALERIQSSARLEKLLAERNQLAAEKQRADEANLAKSQFLSVMNHELRTPLTGIIGFSHLLIDEIYGSLNPKQMQYVSAILESGEYLLELINDLLDISKIEAEKEELFLEKVPVEEICLSAVSLVEERARQAKLTIEIDIARNVGVCIADQRRLKQILVNLLSNAVKFTEEGSVTLRVQQNDKTIQFSVIDTGIGISSEDQQKLFQPFVQINSRLSRNHKGTGLGLALSRQLAQLHDGDITLVSEVGEGSCFTLQLPL